MLHKKTFADLGEGCLNLSFLLRSRAVITAEFKEHIHVRTLYFLNMDNRYVWVIIFLNDFLKRYDASQKVWCYGLKSKEICFLSPFLSHFSACK